MFVYNVTTKIDNGILLPWKKWIWEEQVPEIMATHLFYQNTFFELLELDDPGASTFVMQYFTDSLQNYHTYCREYLPFITKRAEERWGDHFIMFTTLMESLQ